jgi:spoIIIJ-associated protein
MGREVEREGATVEEALEAALDELGIERDEARVEVVQEPKAGVLGVGGREAVVRVRELDDASRGEVAERGAEEPETDAPGSERGSERPDSAGLGDLEEQADAVADFIDELLAKMEIDAIAEPSPRGTHMYVDIVDGPEDDMSLLIGRHGQTLDAIQELARMTVGRRLDERIRVIVDVGDYRKRREAQLEERAREVAERIAEQGGEEELEPMNPYERKLVHDAVAEVPGVETSSRGVEPNRSVVIRKV